jgi:nucleotide-binding universal stress UspA family protein
MHAGYKSILVPLCGDEAEMGAIDFAANLARKMQSEVKALYIGRILQEMTAEQKKDYADRYELGGLREAFTFLDEVYQKRLKSDAAKTKDTVAARLKKHGAAPALHWLENLSLTADVSSLLVNEAMLSDLVIASLASEERIASGDLIGTLPAASGRPVLMMPQSWKDPGECPQTIVIAWKKTVHTARAVTAALTLLQAARKAVVLEIEEGGKPASDPLTADDVAAWLALHGINAEAMKKTARDRKAEAVLDDELARLNADCLVMGSYSRSRMREMVFGGFTQHMRNNLKVPTLFAH